MYTDGRYQCMPGETGNIPGCSLLQSNKTPSMVQEPRERKYNTARGIQSKELEKQNDRRETSFNIVIK